MKFRFRCFTVTAQTLNMRETAQRLFLTQQAVSEQIKRLETEYNTTLFYRKPTLALTPSGVAMLNAIKKIAVIEENLKHELAVIHDDSEGRIRFGLGTYRLHDVVMSIILKFHQLYPKVKIDLFYEDSTKLAKMLHGGQVDLFTGFNVEENKDFEAVPLLEDEVCLLITEQTLNRYFEKEKLDSFLENGIHLAEITPLPFLANYLDGALWAGYLNHLRLRDVQLNVIFSSNDMSDLIFLCAHDLGVTFCPYSLSESIAKYNRTCNQNNPLHLIKFSDFPAVNTVQLIHHRLIYKSNYLEDFIHFIQSSNLTTHKNI